MLNTQINELIANAQADLIGRALDGGYLYLFDGPQEPEAENPQGGQTLLATLRFRNPSARPAVGGVLTSFPLESGLGVAKGEATWYLATKADGVTPVVAGSVGRFSNAPGAEQFNLPLNSTSIKVGTSVAVTQFIHNVFESLSGV